MREDEDVDDDVQPIEWRDKRKCGVIHLSKSFSDVRVMAEEGSPHLLVPRNRKSCPTLLEGLFFPPPLLDFGAAACGDFIIGEEIRCCNGASEISRWSPPYPRGGGGG